MTILTRNLSAIDSTNPREAIETIKRILQQVITDLTDKDSDIRNLDERVSELE